MSEECLKNAQDLTKSQKHESISHSPTWIQEMLAHLISIRTESVASVYSCISISHVSQRLLQ